MSKLLGVLLVAGGFVLYGVVIDVVIVAGGQFLGSCRVGGVRRPNDVAF